MPEVRATYRPHPPFTTRGQWWRHEQRFEVLLSSITLPPPFRLFLENHDDTYFVLRVGDPGATCNVTCRPNPWKGRKWLLSTHMTDGEVVQTAFLALKVAMEHEMREQFTYKGQPLFDPHYDIDKLVALRSNENSIKGREQTA